MAKDGQKATLPPSPSSRGKANFGGVADEIPFPLMESVQREKRMKKRSQDV